MQDRTYYTKFSLYSFFPKLAFFGRSLRKRAVEKLELKRGDKVLDIACGTGLSFKYIEMFIGPKGKITGVDNSKEMLKSAERMVRRKKYTAKLIQGDAANISLPKNHFDGVVSTLGFSAIRDHKRALMNAVGSLKKGKKLVILDGKRFDWRPLNILMPMLRWSKSWDINKDIIRDVKELFPEKKIRLTEYNLGSNFILELTK